MKCEKCGEFTPVTNSEPREADTGAFQWRRRVCRKCNLVFYDEIRRVNKFALDVEASQAQKKGKRSKKATPA